MPDKPVETISETYAFDNRNFKMSQSHFEKIHDDVAGSKRFYTIQWLRDYLDRFEVVDTCSECGEPLIAEETESHQFKHVLPRLRPILRNYVGLTDDDKALVRDFIEHLK